MTRDSHHIAFFVPSLNIGGVESVFLTYSELFLQRGYRVDFVVCKAEGALLTKVPHGVNLIDFSGVRLRKSAGYLRRYLKSNDVGTLITGPDITNFMAIIVNCSLPSKERVNLIVTQHSVFDDDARRAGIRGRLTPLGKRLFYRFASHVVSVSRGVTANLIKGGVPKKKITTIFNPISIAKIERLAEQPIDIKLPQNYIVFVGRLYEVKNVGLLIRAFDKLKADNMDLVIVGDGAMRGEWEALAKSQLKSAQIHFTGALSNPAPVIKGARVVAISSTSEAFPMVVIESLALGRTIAHTPNLGCVEILGDELGYCSHSFDDADNFAATLEKALHSPIDKEILTTMAKKLDESEIMPKFESLIK